MSYRRPITGSAPNYTVPFLWSFGVVVFIALVTIHAIWGFVAAMLVSIGSKAVLDYFADRV